MRLACPNQLSPTQNLLGNGMQLSARNAAGGYLPSDNPASLVGWFRMGVGVTSAGGFASAWADQSGLGHDLLQATGTNQPAYDGSAILTFDGVDNFMKCSAFTLAQPTQVSMLVNAISWAHSDTLFDGNTGNTGRLFQLDLSPRVLIYAGSASVADNNDVTVGSYHAITVLFSGVSSSVLVDAGAPTTGNPGTSSMNGFTLGVFGNDLTAYSNIAVKEIILRNVDDATIRADDHAYLQTL